MVDYKEFIFRNATIDDAAFIAKVVLSAIGRFDFGVQTPEIEAILQSTESICAMEDTLYSYRNTRIAEHDGKPVGGLVAYDGKDYAAMREKTFRIIKERNGIDLNGSDMETQPGEFYIDSLAVIPSERGKEIGKMLLKDIEQQGIAKGHSCFTLIVDATHPKVKDYYATLGFEAEETMNAFETCFVRMKKKTNK